MPNLPGGGGYQVCGLYDLKPAVFAHELAGRNNLVRFSSDFGGETNLYQGFDINLDARLTDRRVPEGRHWRDDADLRQLQPGESRLRGGFAATNVDLAQPINTEVYPDGHDCHREYPLPAGRWCRRLYMLPLDIQISGTYQFSRGIQNGGAGPAVLANWTLASASFAPGGTATASVQSTLGRALNAGAASKSVQLIREGLEYGDDNLHQLDLRSSKRFQLNRSRLRFDFDLYNVFNSNWPYTGTPPFSTATTSQWLRPTNVLQSRFFKLGAQIDF